MKIKYISDEQIWAEADDFRNRFSDYGSPPIDIISIAEIELGMDVVPFPQLFSKYNMDAALSGDLHTIYVDEESYLKWEAGQHWVEKRLRFSFAHELGHYVLHRELIEENRLRSLEDFKQRVRTNDEYRQAEYQANDFAGRLLVPIELLRSEYDRHQEAAARYDPNWRAIEGIREHIAKKIAPRFGVNHQVIEIRFDREGIWPVE